MKIISWNINGYRSITGQNPSKRYDKVTKHNKLFAYIEKELPDIIGLQETKADVEQINEELRCPPGYHAHYHSCSRKKGYSGVVTFTRQEPASVNYKIGIDRFDEEGRIVECDMGDLIHYNVYFPKGYADNERLYFKLDFYDALFTYIKPKLDSGRKIIVSGDYNTAHKECDLARPKDNVKTSGFMPVERDKFDDVIGLGFVDVFRLFTEDNGHYTWWSQRGRARQNNVGWRIDYHLASKNLVPEIVSSVLHPDVDGSDHCPVVMELK